MNKLLEVYSKGFFNNLKEEEIEVATIRAQDIVENYSQKDLRDFFKNKTIRKEDKLNLALELVGESSLKGLVNSLSQNNRFELMPEIFKHFIDYASIRQNKIPVKVTTNKEPNEEMKNNISAFVKVNLGASTPIKYEVSKSLIGGIILKHKDNEIDLSIDNKLNGLKEALIN